MKQHGGDHPSMAELCEKTGSKIEHAHISVKHFDMMLERLKHRETIRGNSSDAKNLEGIFSASHITYNIKNISREYSMKLFPDDVDEREFVQRAENLGSPFTPYTKQIGKVPLSSRGIACDDNVTLSSKLNEVQFPHLISNSPYAIQSMTPNSKLAVTESVSSWIEKYLSKENFNKKSEYIKKRQINGIFAEVATSIKEFKFEPLVEKIDTLQTFYVNCLDELIGNEERRIQKYDTEDSKNIQGFVDNPTFHKAVIACCIESILFTIDNTLTIEDVLTLT